MENEEKEDLLLEVTESEDEIYEKEEIDYYIEKKILDYIQNEKPVENSRGKSLTFIGTCLLVFLSSSVLIVTLPIYLKFSSINNISTYSKLVTLSVVNGVFFVIAQAVGALSKCGRKTNFPNYNLCLADVLKVSFLLSIGNVLIFWFTDDGYVSCHLKDPLKGCSVVFSLFFYFVFSRKKMSLEKTFCAITIIVGVFISVDFGMCDKFRCHGNSNIIEVTPRLHLLYVILYILAHGVWVSYFALVEVCWTTYKANNSNLNVSVLSKVNSGSDNVKPSIQSLSLICQEEQEQMMSTKENNSKTKSEKKSLFCFKTSGNKSNSRKASDNSFNASSLTCQNQISIPDFKKFPLTSTPNNEMNGWNSWTTGRFYDVVFWQNFICILVVIGLCWMPTLQVFHGGKEKLLVDVLSEISQSFQFHLCWSANSQCYNLPVITVLVSVSYVMLILSSIAVLKMSQSAVTVVSIMMSALPLANLFWTLFRLNNGSTNVLELNPEISGEAVCALLGLPIIGIGIVLLVKSHIREFFLPE